MSNEIIQGRYEQLEQIAQQFAGQAEQNTAMMQRVNALFESLLPNGWVGEGAEAFRKEMEMVAMPAMQRLIDALTESSSATQLIIEVMKSAEEEAAAPFRNGGYSGGVPFGGNGGLGGGAVPGSGTPGTVPGGGFGPVATTPIAPTSGSSSGGGNSSFWNPPGFGNLGGESKLFEFDGARGDDGSRKGGKFSPSVGVKYDLIDDYSVWGDPTGDGFSAGGVDASVGVEYNVEEGKFSAGAWGDVYVGRGQVDGVLGDDDLALTGGVEGKVLSADGFIGIKDNSIGASIGGSLVSAKGDVGVNVAGVNVGVSGEIGLKAELGFKIGQETEIKLPFISFGISFGGAKKDD